MTGAVQAAGVVAAVPGASWLKFITVGADGPFDRGFSSIAPVAGSIALGDQVGGRVATRFMYSADVNEFNFQIDETNPAGFTFTSIVVEAIPGFSYITLTRASAVAYSGFPIAGWIWSGVPFIWAPADVGQVRTIEIRR